MVEKIATENIEQPTVFSIAAEKLLKEGQAIRFSAAGNSMHPTVRQGDTLVVAPCNPASLAVGDIAFFKDAGRLFAHRIISIEPGPETNTEPALAGMFSAPRAESPLPESCCRQDDSEAGCSVTIPPQVQRSLSGPEASPPNVQRSTTHRDLRDLRFVLRGDFRSTPDPPIGASQILGKVVAVERNHKARSPYGIGKQFFAATYRISSHLKSFLLFGQ